MPDFPAGVINLRSNKLDTYKRFLEKEVSDKSLGLFTDLGLDPSLAPQVELPLVIQVILLRLLARLEYLEDRVETLEKPNEQSNTSDSV